MPGNQVAMSGDKVTFSIAYPKGDTRLFYIDFTSPQSAAVLATTAFTLAYRQLLRIVNNRIAVTLPSVMPYKIDLISLSGRRILDKSGIGSGMVAVPLSKIGRGTYIVRLSTTGYVITERVHLAR